MQLAPITHAQTSEQAAEIYERLQRLEQRQAEFEKLLDVKDKRIRELEAELEQQQKQKSALPEQPTIAAPTTAVSAEASPDATAGNNKIESTIDKSDSEQAIASAIDAEDPKAMGEFTPGKGFTVARTKYGELNLSVYSYIRYLNQNGLNDTYVDHFGVVQPIDKRNDFQVNKVFLYTKGWFLNPKFRYLFYVWSTATALGNTSNNLVAGNISYKFNEKFNLTGGVVGLPSTRSMMGQFPYWHRVDTRLMADEFMRGSFTQGLSADGRLARGLDYRFAVGNNLSNFGVNASKLDNDINTFSGALAWMPTTGEFGPHASIGDFEQHTDLATLFGLHATYSTEDKQSQPGMDSPENTQIRLSDGVTVFTPNALAPGVTVNKLDYQMVAVNAGMKYDGYALEGEIFYRKLNNFQTNSPLLIDELIDKGFQIKMSTMLMPKTVQLYANGSKIFGDYGDPWDAGIGANWWPFKRLGFRFNAEAIYLRNSPVGYNSVPYTVGGTGWVFVTNAEVAF